MSQACWRRGHRLHHEPKRRAQHQGASRYSTGVRLPLARGSVRNDRSAMQRPGDPAALSPLIRPSGALRFLRGARDPRSDDAAVAKPELEARTSSAGWVDFAASCGTNNTVAGTAPFGSPQPARDVPTGNRAERSRATTAHNYVRRARISPVCACDQHPANIPRRSDRPREVSRPWPCRMMAPSRNQHSPAYHFFVNTPVKEGSV